MPIPYQYLCPNNEHGCKHKGHNDQDVERSRLRKRLPRSTRRKRSHPWQTAVRSPLGLQEQRKSTTTTVTHTRLKYVTRAVIPMWFSQRRHHGRTISLLSTEGSQKTLYARFQAAHQRHCLTRCKIRHKISSNFMA